MRVTCDALAVEKPIWMLGDSATTTRSAGTTTCWPQGVVPVAPYNARNTDDPKDIEYRVEARIDEHSEDVQLKQSTLDKDVRVYPPLCWGLGTTRSRMQGFPLSPAGPFHPDIPPSCPPPTIGPSPIRYSVRFS